LVDSWLPRIASSTPEHKSRSLVSAPAAVPAGCVERRRLTASLCIDTSAEVPRSSAIAAFWPRNSSRSSAVAASWPRSSSRSSAVAALWPCSSSRAAAIASVMSASCPSIARRCSPAVSRGAAKSLETRPQHAGVGPQHVGVCPQQAGVGRQAAQRAEHEPIEVLLVDGDDAQQIEQDATGGAGEHTPRPRQVCKRRHRGADLGDGGRLRKAGGDAD
jgi:hypothetical protein